MKRSMAPVWMALLLSSSPALAGEPTEHVVQPGENLWQIAGRLGGNPQLWPLLYRANRDQIKDPSMLYPGQALQIPDLHLEGGRAAGEGAAAATPQARH